MLELGCGCGLLATAALKIFPHILKYFATDGHWRSEPYTSKYYSHNLVQSTSIRIRYLVYISFIYMIPKVL